MQERTQDSINLEQVSRILIRIRRFEIDLFRFFLFPRNLSGIVRVDNIRLHSISAFLKFDVYSRPEPANSRISSRCSPVSYAFPYLNVSRVSTISSCVPIFHKSSISLRFLSNMPLHCLIHAVNPLDLYYSCTPVFLSFSLKHSRIFIWSFGWFTANDVASTVLLQLL